MWYNTIMKKVFYTLVAIIILVIFVLVARLDREKYGTLPPDETPIVTETVPFYPNNSNKD